MEDTEVEDATVDTSEKTGGSAAAVTCADFVPAFLVFFFFPLAAFLFFFALLFFFLEGCSVPSKIPLADGALVIVDASFF